MSLVCLVSFSLLQPISPPSGIEVNRLQWSAAAAHAPHLFSTLSVYLETLLALKE